MSPRCEHLRQGWRWEGKDDCQRWLPCAYHGCPEGVSGATSLVFGTDVQPSPDAKRTPHSRYGPGVFERHYVREVFLVKANRSVHYFWVEVPA
jgi:hypothetical protein